ncbi:MAG TPA: type II toxin-antitoxin system VapB family antitoxin [Thermoanaerobaculia bacterium]|nr:type II toxin-antitoxin system VapB family antitoxin [Thermoanaerobaculia bacterium]
MKRTNVVLDEKLLEKARRASGERTYSAAINKALAEYVKKRDFREAYRKFAEEAKKGGFFHEGYLEEIRPNAYAVIDAKKKRRVSADEKRVPRKKSVRRGAR